MCVVLGFLIAQTNGRLYLFLVVLALVLLFEEGVYILCNANFVISIRKWEEMTFCTMLGLVLALEREKRRAVCAVLSFGVNT